MRHGVLYKKSKLSIQHEVDLARRQFYRAGHCAGFAPAEARFNPVEMPKQRQIHGLEVVSDERVKPGHIRICTADLDDRQELAVDRAEFAGSVENLLAPVAGEPDGILY